jgi:RNA recognition motif-containing protein
VQPENGVRMGETFRVSEQCVGKDGVLHLRVTNGRGWIPSTKPNGEILCELVNAAQFPVCLKSAPTDSPKQEQALAEMKEMTCNRTSSLCWDDVTEEELGGQNKIGENRTTVVITNIATNCTRDGLLAKLDDAGLVGQYDFVYLPVSFETLATHGYGIVNFVSSRAAQMMMEKFPNSVSFSDQRQGLADHVANFQDSSLMHEGVPDQFKPLLFKDGHRIPFPPPTRPTRMPRELKRAIWRMKNGELASENSPPQLFDVSPKSQLDQSSPRCLKSPTDRRGGRVTNSRRSCSRRDHDSCA